MFVWLWKCNKCARLSWFKKHFLEGVLGFTTTIKSCLLMLKKGSYLTYFGAIESPQWFSVQFQTLSQKQGYVWGTTVTEDTQEDKAPGLIHFNCLKQTFPYSSQIWKAKCDRYHIYYRYKGSQKCKNVAGKIVMQIYGTQDKFQNLVNTTPIQFERQ